MIELILENDQERRQYCMDRFLIFSNQKGFKMLTFLLIFYLIFRNFYSHSLEISKKIYGETLNGESARS